MWILLSYVDALCHLDPVDYLSGALWHLDPVGDPLSGARRFSDYEGMRVPCCHRQSILTGSECPWIRENRSFRLIPTDSAFRKGAGNEDPGRKVPADSVLFR